MKQQTLGGFQKYGKTTRRAQFLADMDRVVPWNELMAVVDPVYPKVSDAGGRPPIPLERMLRIYFLQLWFNLSDPAVEEALYDSAAMRGFVGVDLGAEAAPDETTVCKFRHLLERNKLGKKLLSSVNEHLKRNGIKINNGTIVDATIISAPSSTKNKDGQRDPEMHQTAKGNQWYFGMKAHLGVDSKTKLIHTILASAAHVPDVDALRVRAKVEHTIGVIKRIFGFQKVRYRGLAKNLHRLEVTAALANLFMMRRRLLDA
jgi:IS5 family transposase